MTANGKEIQNFLDDFQREMSLGCVKYDRSFSLNGTISCR